MIEVKDKQAGKFEVQFGPAEYKAIRAAATSYGLKRGDIVGSIIHKGLEVWGTAILDKEFAEVKTKQEDIIESGGDKCL